MGPMQLRQYTELPSHLSPLHFYSKLYSSSISRVCLNISMVSCCQSIRVLNELKTTFPRLSPVREPDPVPDLAIDLTVSRPMVAEYHIKTIPLLNHFETPANLPHTQHRPSTFINQSTGPLTTLLYDHYLNATSMHPTEYSSYDAGRGCVAGVSCPVSTGWVSNDNSDSFCFTHDGGSPEPSRALSTL
ncbi:hypothetical protein EJ05DRAFT_386503 [Pseudovirgaria hyperparasitica]|uniref:Uncharacterized protein n=1 Tax=Pseudovirgaria hyperparasitica TaxID=470096 RepID=A0A6A6W5L7_9PEZI|nr:uncharacterized protein EJ05DRAFT_386503 [Pseudovirgaria hyperparasitica]KAF2757324.1 hypothetical protein EJ05DRAFT_386503 [Pseudovirgaria hyperparasitica]